LVGIRKIDLIVWLGLKNRGKMGLAQLLYNSEKLFKNDKENFNVAMDNLYDGNDAYQDSSFGIALNSYIRANDFNPNNSELNYKIGICYINSADASKALPYLQEAYKLDREIAKDIKYRIGQSYQSMLNFDKAIEEYNGFKISLSPNILYNWHTTLQKRFKECTAGKELMKKPTIGMIISLNEINSQFAEYCPLISADESMMIFTSKRKETTGGLRDPFSLEFYEDIYISYNENGIWGTPTNIGAPVNTVNHDATVGLSPDGQELYVYKGIKKSGDIYAGDIYYCELKGSEWSKSKALPNSINSPYSEFSASISFDGRTLYFTSNRPNGYGKKDIYICTKEANGDWGNATNIGNIINTEYDEEGVFAHPDGKTLYFSSKGHNTMGGYDVFKSAKNKNGIWSKPENIGYPINTGNDDIFFVTSADGRHGYFSSIKQGGKGSTDIYMINFTAFEDDNKTVNLTLVKGKVKDSKTGKFIEAKIEIFDNEKNEIIAVFNSNSETGEYLITLPSGKNYGIAVYADDYLFNSANFDLPESKEFGEIILDVELESLEKGSKIILNNLFFKHASSELEHASLTELNRIVKILKDSPDMRIEIGGHTDNTNSLATNQRLSTNRSKSVVDYLINNGINNSRLEYKGYAFYQPIADNKTEEGRKQNRRVEFKILNN